MKQRFYWTEEKIEELKRIWNTQSLYKLAAYFHTTEDTIEKKGEELGLPAYKSNRWTKEEEEKLREYAKEYVTQTIADKLGRSYLSVQKKALKLGIELHSEPDPWLPWKIKYLKENINKKSIGEIESTLEISYHRILTKCKDLGIEYKKESWTEEEVNTLRKYADKCHYTELVKVLPNRTVGAIAAKAYELGIETISDYHKLNEEYATYIKENWGILPGTQIARNLKISTGILQRYKKELNLPNVGQQTKWTEERIKKLKKDAKAKNRNELAKKYKTSVTQITKIAAVNGIPLIDARSIWNEELDKQLLLYAEDYSIPEIAQKMQIKAANIRTRLKRLDRNKYNQAIQNRRKWSMAELNILQEMSTTLTSFEIADILGKTEKQVASKARRLGIELENNRHHLWREEESKILIELSEDYDLHLIAKVLNRSEATVSKKAKELGIQLHTKNRTLWTSEEEEKLRGYAKEYSSREISYFMDRSEASIIGKLKYLGITPQKSQKFWTSEEVSQLIILAKEYSIDEIAIEMGKTCEAISYKLNQLGLKTRSKASRPWTIEEEQNLQELLTTFSAFEVAELLNRSEEAIITRAIKLGFIINGKNRKWTREEELLLEKLWGSVSIENLAKKLNRTASAIINRAFLLGLGSQLANNYDGLSIQNIAELLNVQRNTILTTWVILGLKLNFRKRSNGSTYAYVTLENLYDFLETHQEIWDSRNFKRNSLGMEPGWLKEKRRKDKDGNEGTIGSSSLLKQQLLVAQKYYLEMEKANNQAQKEQELELKKVMGKEEVNGK